MDNSVDALLADTPAGMVPLLTMGAPNERLELHSGPISVIRPGRTAICDAAISLEWLPTPSIIARYEPNGMDDLQWTLSGGRDARVQIAEPPVESVAFLRSTTIGSTSSSMSLYVDRFQSASDGMCAALFFQVVNFADFYGHPIAFDRKSVLCGRLEFPTDEWLVTLDATPGSSKIVKALADTGGYGITHTARIERNDASEFAVTEGLDVMRAFLLFLSLCRGRTVGVVAVRGVDSRGANTYEEWLASVMSPWRPSHNWFPARNTAALGGAFAPFLNLWHKEDWRETLLHTIYWYNDANEGVAGIEGSIALAQIALERLAWMVLVIDRKTISANRFNRLKAADAFRLLFNQLRIPLLIPARLTDLRGYCDQNNLGDLPESIVHFRKAVVHPPKRTKASPGHEVLYQACESELWSLELAHLAILGYTGNYHNRVNIGRRWAHDSELVPWASAPVG